jgi:glycosyltransferase involved in cell wall biosynthesis
MIGVFFGMLFGCKHLYYMHSDLSQQLVSSEFIEHPLLIRLARAVQAFMVRRSNAIIAICPDIEKTVKQMAPRIPVYMIENAAVDEGLPAPELNDVELLRQKLCLGDGPVLLYTGNLECYQGIELLLQSIPSVHAVFPDARYVIVGGQPCQIEKLSALAEELGITEAVCFVGHCPLAEMPVYMALANILLSPRTKGTNTPLKLYTYLHSGKPILATDIFSQAQVLTSETAMLVGPTPHELAQGALALLHDPVQARMLGERGWQLANEHYSWHAFYKRSKEAQLAFINDTEISLAVS